MLGKWICFLMLWGISCASQRQDGEMEREEGRRQWLLLRLLKPYIIQTQLQRGASVSDQGDKTGKNSNPSIQLSNTKSQTQQRPDANGRVPNRASRPRLAHSSATLVKHSLRLCP
ncbi:hypothetical protein V8C43DRAFT_278159 [Trichoderma afarasin]